ncbi:MAG: tyrosine-type recombinase/integrase [Chloroflexi bacterium]|nr:tyrosine-type recombinase/integrase [Chloroflexota bacterium]
MTKSTGKLPFHFTNTLPPDPAVQRFGDWLPANREFYAGFRRWLKESSYSDSALGIYGSAARTAIGFLRKPYWRINPESDLALAYEHLRQRHSSPATCSGYQKGLCKLAEYIRLRNRCPEKPKELHWEHYIGSLPACLQTDVREFMQYRQCFWKTEQKFELATSVLGHLTLSLRWMAEHTGLREIADLTPQAWLAYLDHRISAGISPSTLNGELSGLKHLIFYQQEQERKVCERFLLMGYLKKSKPLPKDVPVEQLRHLIRAVQAEAAFPYPGRRRNGRMDLAWFLLMLHSGLRSAEIRNLKMKDIEWEARRLRIVQAKGMKDRLVYLSQASLSALREYLEVRGPAEALPENVFIYRHRPLSKTYLFMRMRTYGRRCGVHAAPHHLRHSCATLLLNAGAPVVTVQTILGHKNVDTTMGYARLYDGTVAADYYQAMNLVERQLALPEDRLAQPPSPGELLALVDALRNGTLNPAQTEIVWALRSGLALLADRMATINDVKVLCCETSAVRVPR